MMETFVQKQPIAKLGKRISKEELLKYIETNKETAKNINIVDLNEVIPEQEFTSIEKAPYQAIQEIRFLPENLSKIFKIGTTKYLHTGCLKSINAKNGKHQTNLQISLLSSIITCFHSQFSLMSVSNQAIFINKVFDRLRVDSSGTKFAQFKYNKLFKWKKEDIENDLMKNNYSGKVLKFLCDYFHINIFIIDIEKDQLCYPGNKYIPYRNTIFVLKFEDGTFEPVSIQNMRVFGPALKLIENIRKNPDYVTVINLGESMSLGIEEENEDLTKYLPQIEKPRNRINIQKTLAEQHEKVNVDKNCEPENQYKEDTCNSDNEIHTDLNQTQKLQLTQILSSESESDNDDDNKKIKKLKPKNNSKYKIADIKTSLKLDELRNIATDLNINITGKTKSVLTTEIKSKLQN